MKAHLASGLQGQRRHLLHLRFMWVKNGFVEPIQGFMCFFLSLLLMWPEALATWSSLSPLHLSSVLAVALFSTSSSPSCDFLFFPWQAKERPIAEHNPFQGHLLRDRVWSYSPTTSSFPCLFGFAFLPHSYLSPFMYLQELTGFWHRVQSPNIKEEKVGTERHLGFLLPPHLLFSLFRHFLRVEFSRFLVITLYISII